MSDPEPDRAGLAATAGCCGGCAFVLIVGGGLLVALAVWVAVVLLAGAVLLTVLSGLHLSPEAQVLLAVVQFLFRLPLFVLESLAPLVPVAARPDAGC
ncbi:MAG: hypothetical protein K2X87_21595 [Gemmataceae bacterium]|nr:hypothetical protein [Gemmataceae bacterium]